MSDVYKGPGNGGEGENYKYLQPCLARRHSFTTMVYSADKILGMEAVATHQPLALMLSNKLKREYLEMCGFVRARVLLAKLSSNTLLLCGTRYKEAYIQQRPNLEYVEFMELWQV